MIEISLTKGQVAIVDDEDADLAEYKWFANFVPTYGNGGAYLAYRKCGRCKGKQHNQLMHRVILARMLERLFLLPDEQVDHYDLNPLNNRRSNLRLATRSQNQMNQGRQKNNTSGFKGVSWNKKSQKWMTFIGIEGRRIYLGSFDAPEEAHLAYCKAAEKLHGEFARVE